MEPNNRSKSKKLLQTNKYQKRTRIIAKSNNIRIHILRLVKKIKKIAKMMPKTKAQKMVVTMSFQRKNTQIMNLIMKMQPSHFRRIKTRVNKNHPILMTGRSHPKKRKRKAWLRSPRALSVKSKSRVRSIRPTVSKMKKWTLLHNRLD